MDDSLVVPEGQIISVRTRRDVVVTDPERFLAAARQALRDNDPTLTEAGAAAMITDVYDAVHALLDRDGQLAADARGIEVGRGAPLPGTRATDRPDGLSPAGWMQQIVLNEPRPLQDYGCFLPEDVFTIPPEGVFTIPPEGVFTIPPEEGGAASAGAVTIADGTGGPGTNGSRPGG